MIDGASFHSAASPRLRISSQAHLLVRCPPTCSLKRSSICTCCTTTARSTEAESGCLPRKATCSTSPTFSRTNVFGAYGFLPSLNTSTLRTVTRCTKTTTSRAGTYGATLPIRVISTTSASSAEFKWTLTVHSARNTAVASRRHLVNVLRWTLGRSSINGLCMKILSITPPAEMPGIITFTCRDLITFLLAIRLQCPMRVSRL